MAAHLETEDRFFPGLPGFSLPLTFVPRTTKRYEQGKESKWLREHNLDIVLCDKEDLGLFRTALGELLNSYSHE